MATNIARRREIPVLITSITILIILAAYFFNIKGLSDGSSFVQRMSIIIAAIASGVGLISITLLMAKRVRRRQEGEWYFAIYGLVLMYVTVIIGLFYGPLSTFYIKYFQSVQVPLYCALTGLLIFFITTATYRAFRARTIESALLLISGILVLIGNAPIGEIISPIFPSISTWILDVPNQAASRGMTIGAGIGVIVLGLRVLVGKERSAAPGGA